MKKKHPIAKCTSQGGFTLVATLLILAAVTILVIGLFSLSSIEKTTASSYDAIEQAELAVQAGFAHAAKMLDTATRSEMNIIMKSYAGDDPEGRPRDLTMSAWFNPATLAWDYIPFASGVNAPLSTPTLMKDSDFDGDGRADPIPLEATQQQSEEELYTLDRMDHPIPSRSVPPMYWETLALPAADDAEEKVAARYSFFVEDLQANLSLERVGNEGDPEPRMDGTVIPPPVVTQQRRQSLDDYEKYVEDLEELTGVGNLKRHIVPGMTLRELNSPWTRPAMSEVALYTLENPSFMNDDATLLVDNHLVRNRSLIATPWSWKEVLATPDSLIPWGGIQRDRAFLREEPLDGYSDPILARLEDSTVSGIRAYDEAALIPTYPGVLTGGTFKMNLNKVLKDLEKTEEDAEVRRDKRDEAVVSIAQHILDQLPEFASMRRGGFPLGGEEDADDDDDKDGMIDPPKLDLTIGPQPAETNTQKTHRDFAYLKTLAAGMIDYADTDPLPTIRLGHYRGMDAYPIVSEHWQGYHSIGTDGPNVIIRLSHYSELWNTTNQPISGEMQWELDAQGGFASSGGTRSIIDVVRRPGSDASIIGRLPIADDRSPPEKKRFWLNAVSPSENGVGTEPLVGVISLKPGEYRVVKWQDIDFRVKTTVAGEAATRKFNFEGFGQAKNDASSRYKLRFKPSQTIGDANEAPSEFSVVDLPLAPVVRYPRSTPGVGQAKCRFFNGSYPGWSYSPPVDTSGVRPHKNNLGDPRAAFFINYYQDYSNYQGATSPWGRGLKTTVSDVTAFHYSVEPSLWPDGGHPSTKGFTPESSPSKGGAVGYGLHRLFGRDEWLDPYYSNPSPTKPAVTPNAHVQVISNRGRYYSVSELGHVYDPLMWAPYSSDPSDTAAPPPTSFSSFADIRAGTSAPSARFCGGNTLRIGRVEHSRFRPDYGPTPASGRPSNRRGCATTLLDLFHSGIPMPEKRRADEPEEMAEARQLSELTGNLTRIDGQINLNTATYDAIRATIVGKLVSDPGIVQTLPTDFPKLHGKLATETDMAGYLARQIIANRPYISPSELPEKVVEAAASPTQPNVALLGVTSRPSDRTVTPEWNDAAAEEIFARLFNSTTVRSRNFRVVVTGQSIRMLRSGGTNVLASRSRLYHVFVKPMRDASGMLISQKVEITYVRSY